MKRRDFLPFTNNESISDSKIKAPRVLSGLNEYKGTFGNAQLQHLLRRTGFGLTPSELKAYNNKSLSEMLKLILTTSPEVTAPVNYTTGANWTVEPYDKVNAQSYLRQLKGWCLNNYINSGISIHEKMTLFWHNLLVTEGDNIADPRYTYIYYTTLRKNALGNIKEMITAITKDISMLRYLNGNTNIKGKPNENFARELQELFTIGKGPEISPGNYTNYTEDDIKAAARVLTGWVDNFENLQSSFFPNKHDSSDKTFSSAYQNTVIKGTISFTGGDEELAALINMIFKQRETARYYCRKLYRWFVYYEIDDLTEKNVIEPLADVLINNNYEILPVLNALFSSEHFFDPENYWVMIKNPIDFITHAIKMFEIKVPDLASDAQNHYALLDKLIISATAIEMNLLDPPNVAGWPAYYQTPDFYQNWINTSTLPNRNGFTDAIVYGSKYYGTPFTWEIIDYVKKYISNPADASTLIKELTDLIMFNQLSSKQLTYLAETILMQSVPTYEWTNIWQTYISKPNDAAAKNNVKTRLQALLRFILRMAEFQLS